MLYEVVQAKLSESLQPRESYHPFPVYEEREAWEALPVEIKQYYKELSEALSASDLLAPLPAARYMDYVKNGNRTRYEKLHFARRANLMTLVVAECIAGDGGLMEPICDLVWAICEETSWVIPAHNGAYDTGGALPDIEQPVNIDLFAAETGSALSWVCYLLREALDAQSPLIARRVELEVKRRILDPYMTDDSFWWLSFADNAFINNWNPWVNSSVLNAFLLMEEDEERRKAAVLRNAKSLDRFIGAYFPDGGCDEGPGYFTVAGGALFDALEVLHGATGGAVAIYEEPLIQNMAKYIYRVHAGADFYVNFADATARVDVPTGLLLRIGKAIGDDALRGFARHVQAHGLSGIPYSIRHDGIFRALRNLFTYEYIAKEEAPYTAPKAHMFDGIQVMTARQAANSSEGFFLACKGGHNAESHNHNDIGNFILYKDARPIIIDAGVETYTKQTFSNRRYEIWTMRSDYHSLPDINGVTQHEYEQYAARDVRHADDGTVSSMTLDIAGAYPEAACVIRYERDIRFDRAAQTVTVSDSYILSEAKVPIVMHLLCAEAPVNKDGMFVIDGVALAYDADMFAAEVEALPITDEKMTSAWQRDCLYRICLTQRAANMVDAFAFVFTNLK